MSAGIKADADTWLDVRLGERSYPIGIGRGILETSGERLAALLPRRRAFIVTDTTVAALHLPRLLKTLSAQGITAEVFTVPPGEASKCFAEVERLTNALLFAGIERSDRLIALGGGVIGDLAGFAAAITLRGVDFIQIPTTLLAQVDSSVGGKTGIDTPVGKNTVGAFHQPRLVLCDLATLETLPLRELRAGYAEIVKYGVIESADFFGFLERDGERLLAGDTSLRAQAVAQSCAFKATIVAADEREAGKRALLNLGHTFGHALEVETGFGDRLLHGEAVSIGMVFALDLSARLGLAPPSDHRRLAQHLKACGLPTAPSDLGIHGLDPQALLAHMRRDKKVKDGRITLILARGIGAAFETRQVDEGALLSFLRDMTSP